MRQRVFVTAQTAEASPRRVRRMRFMELESSRTAYRADFAVYGLAVALLVLGLSAHISVEPKSRTSTQLLPALVLAGYTLWAFWNTCCIVCTTPNAVLA